MASNYGAQPTVVDTIQLDPQEMCFVQYLPIGMAEQEGLGDFINIPQNLSWVSPLINSVWIEDKLDLDNYIYLTVKHLYVTPSNMGNRPGWHSDGFGTEDINYIWSDKYPTEFCIQDFDITEDCQVSLKEMEEQASLLNVKTYGDNTLLRLDKYNIHRTPLVGEGYRTFVKISVSKNRYNLKGNAHNYLFDYEWGMIERAETRNHPSK